ncbi:sulfotransferase family protein [Enhygromyxa salina]|uniref:Sulfotransferase domain protein n=1 Tax=Enhygromyxa salina TaxID=215803 RepID=A0A2S9YJN5_9BACT|nr:sulfotransferase [Enhygromyxa salina]PRQ05246.1 Sulfotransferase domain protein [Enhygromyxa salina]
MSSKKLWFVNRVMSVLPTPSLDDARLLEAAAKLEGKTDFGDGRFEAGLAVLTRSLERDAKLSPMGREAVYRMIVRNLCMRLRLVADQRRRPEIYAKPLTPPILVLGLPRAGTTFLHRLLSAMPGARPGRTWEVNQPLAPSEGKDDRYRQAAKQVAMIRKLAPDLDAKHRLDPDEPEECVFLLNPSFCSIAWWMIAPVYSYLDWYGEQDLGPAYREYHAYLRALQAAEPGRLVLKAPAHTGHLAQIISEIPDVVVVYAHRDPVTVVASVSSLFNSVFGLVTEHHDVQRTARRNLDLFISMTDRCQAARDQGLDDRVLDIHYDDLVADPIATARRIYAHGSIPWPDDGEQALRAHMQGGRRSRPKHVYSLEDCGLTEAEVRGRFAPYAARYLSR